VIAPTIVSTIAPPSGSYAHLNPLLASGSARIRFPVAPAILGMVLGAMLEEHFIRAMIRADGNFIAFFERPIAGSLGAMTLAVVSVPLIRWMLRSRMRVPGGGINR
jgi:TctA family transporter